MSYQETDYCFSPAMKIVVTVTISNDDNLTFTISSLSIFTFVTDFQISASVLNRIRCLHWKH